MELSVIRRSAKTASASVARLSGGASCHQVTTGASAASSGSTTDSACSPRRPYIRMTIASPGPSRPPMTTSASRRGTGASICRRTTTSMRQGCAAAAWDAASSASVTRLSSATTTRVSATPDSTAPPVRRCAASSFTTAEPVVSQRVVTTWFSSDRRGSRGAGDSRPTPPAVLGGEHLVGRPRAPLAGPGGMGRRPGPELLERVDDGPGGLDLRVAREQRRVAEEHVEQEALVGLGAALGELLPVEEVHRHVADLHDAARHLRSELEGHAFVGLHADDELVVPQFLGVGVGEGQVRRPLEDQGDLGDAPGEALAGAQVERHPRPAAGLDPQPDRRVGLGLRFGVDALLLAVTDGPLAGQPALLVLAPDGEGGHVL